MKAVSGSWGNTVYDASFGFILYYRSHFYFIGALVSGNILCAFLSGTLCGFLLPWLLIKCAKNSLLPTSTAILSVGASAIISGIFASIFCDPLNFLAVFLSQKLSEFTTLLALHLCGSAFLGFIFFGGILGWAVSWGSENGYYHLVMLPLIAIYMDGGRFCVLGLLDMLCLCVPCAGVCSAVYFVVAFSPPKKTDSTPLNKQTTQLQQEDEKSSDEKSEVEENPITVNDDVIMDYDHHLRLGKKGTFSNLLMGDYVEACYPYTVSNRWVLLSVRISSVIAGGLVLGYFGAQADCLRNNAFSSSSSSSFSSSFSPSFSISSPPSASSSSSSTNFHSSQAIKMHRRSGDSYPFQSSAYLPLPVAMLLAVLSPDKPCIPVNNHCTAASSTCRIDDNPQYVTGNGIFAATYNAFILIFHQIINFSHLGARVSLIIALLIVFFLPFFTTIFIYSDKRKLKPLH